MRRRRSAGVPAVILENDLDRGDGAPRQGRRHLRADLQTGRDRRALEEPVGTARAGGGVPTAADSATSPGSRRTRAAGRRSSPTAAAANTYRGVELNFHGEASTGAWDYEITAGARRCRRGAALRPAARAVPSGIERTMRVEAGQPVLALRERITNEGRETLDCMWGHHPAYGAPFLSGACRIDTNARTVHRRRRVSTARSIPLTQGSDVRLAARRARRRRDRSLARGRSGRPAARDDGLPDRLRRATTAGTASPTRSWASASGWSGRRRSSPTPGSGRRCTPRPGSPGTARST